MTRQSVNPIVYLDANPFIYLIEGERHISDDVQPLFAALKASPGAAVTSEITLAEVLAPNKRRGALDPAFRRLYLDLIVFGGSIGLEPVSRDILYETAELRRVASLKGLVDAIHLATAVRSGCRYFVSRDSDFRRMPSGMEKVLPEKDALAQVIEALS